MFHDEQLFCLCNKGEEIDFALFAKSALYNGSSTAVLLFCILFLKIVSSTSYSAA